MVGKGRFEFTSTITIIVVHFGHVLDEFGLRLRVATPPILISYAVSIIVLTVNVVFIDLPVSIVISIVDWAVVNIVI